LKILIRHLKFEAIIGILGNERVSPQTVIIDMEIEYNYSNGEFIDYVQVVEIIKKTVKSGKYHLLEDAINSLSKVIYSKFPSIESIDCRISKPNVFNECIVLVQNRDRF